MFHEIQPERVGPTYVKAYVDKEREIVNLIEKNPYLYEQIDELAEKYMGRSLSHWPEHLGNIYMVWHDEEFRNIEVTSHNNPNGVFVRFETRQGHHRGGELVVYDAHDPASVVACNRYRVNPNERELFIELNDMPHLFRVEFFADGQGLVTMNKTSTFIQYFDTRMGVSEREVVMTVKDENGEDHKTAAVAKYRHEKSIIGQPVDDLHRYYWKSKRAHDREQLEPSREFIFFNGDKDDEAQQENLRRAKEAVRDVLNRGHEVVYVCDPYFKAKDLIEYLHHVKSSDVKIRVINSKADVGVKGLKQLLPLVRSYNKGMQNEEYIQCRVLRGEKSMLHDRFIVADDTVWNLGASFSEFGSRACTLSRLSVAASKIVKEYIEQWWNSDLTRPLEDYEHIPEPPRNIICETLKKLKKRLCPDQTL